MTKHPVFAAYALYSLMSIGCADETTGVGDGSTPDGAAGERDGARIDDGSSATVDGGGRADAALERSRLGEGTACDLPSLASQAAPPGAVDCGVATMASELARWRAVDECMTRHFTAGESFYGAFELDNFVEPDSIRGFGLIGIAGSPYVLREVLYDSDPSGGAMIDPRAQTRICVMSGLRQSCQTKRGEVCVACFDSMRPDLMDLCPGWPR